MRRNDMVVRLGVRKRQSGVSSIELMVGMVLGLILIGGAISIFLASKRSYTEVEQVSELTESAQFATRLLDTALLHVGFLGEAAPGSITQDPGLPVISSDDDCAGEAAVYDLENYLFATVVANSKKALDCIEDGAPGSHVLVVKSVAPTPFSDGPRVNPDPDIATHVDGVIDELVANRLYVMTNDTVGVLFEGSAPPGILTGGEVPGGVAWAYRYEVFYIKNAVQDANGNELAPPMLSRKVLVFSGGAFKVVTEDLVEGVENLRLRFGLGATGGEVASFVAVGDMASGDWERVESVEMTVLVRATNEDFDYIDPKSYSLPGGDFTPDDNYRRILITNSISLRNPKLSRRGV